MIRALSLLPEVGFFLLEITLERFNYGDYVVYPPNEYTDCAQWQIFKPSGERLTGALHKTIKDKIKSKLKREKNMSSDCCENYPAPKAYACKAQPPASATTPYTKSSNYTPITTIEAGTSITFANLPPMVSMPADYRYGLCSGIMPNKKDEQMFNSTSDLEIQQRNFLKTRATDLEASKRSEARKAFNMDYVYIPKTKDEFLAALKEGSFTVNDGYFTEDGLNRYGYNVSSLLQCATFSDPKSPRDEDGYKAAKAKLAQALIDLKDTITVAPLTDAVAAFEAFKKTTFH